jgi:hypothetical protein
MAWRISSNVIIAAPMTPHPPASLTAAASLDPVTVFIPKKMLPIPAQKTGYSIPIISQIFVLSTFLGMIDTHLVNGFQKVETNWIVILQYIASI